MIIGNTVRPISMEAIFHGAQHLEVLLTEMVMSMLIPHQGPYSSASNAVVNMTMEKSDGRLFSESTSTLLESFLSEPQLKVYGFWNTAN